MMLKVSDSFCQILISKYLSYYNDLTGLHICYNELLYHQNPEQCLGMVTAMVAVNDKLRRLQTNILI